LEVFVDYFANNLDSYLTAVREHIMISLIVILIAGLIGISLGVLCAKFQSVKPFIMGIFSTLRIVPSLAVLILMIPIIGVGVTSAVIALIFLAIPPILINTMLAFDSLPPSVLETALGMGMSQKRIFLTVKFPLALPLIMTGIRTAMAEVIASATLATYIGAGGLGNLIFTGLGLMRSDLLLIGGVSVAILSLSAGLLLSCLESRLFRYKNLKNN
jgi:osmoprotectant transport system permease protein